nr:methionine--tRNA ligase [Pseudomonadota bacterium]
MSEPFYITTAISYPNGRPHIGHAYEAIAADIIARFQRSRGRDVRFQTGTDEHGLKMAQAARGEGVEPAAYANKMSALFKDMCDRLEVSYDRFIRTTEPAHHRASQAIWKAMEDRGDLYLSRYEGWYSVRDEAYYDESELVAGESGEKLSPQGTPVEWTAEESWFFRLSAYQQKLLDLYAANPDFIQPESRRNEVLRFVEGGLSDLSVSRTSFDWGVKVPGSDGHVMYVWLDALTNYLTGVGYPDRGELFERYWPADVHLIGKDVVRFHAVYWPAFLISAGIALPRKVYGHGFLLSRGEKMSKSVGNVVDPFALADSFGVDALRYFLMREVPFGQDGSYSAEAIVARVNAELANSFGNLAQRTLSMVFKNLGGVLPQPGEAAEDRELLQKVETACAELTDRFEALAFSVGLEAWMGAVFACNAYVDAQAPWALRKTDPERMAAV